MTQPDRHRNRLILVAIALSLLFCLRFYIPPLTSHQPFSIAAGQPAWLGNPFYLHQSLAAWPL